MHYLEYQPQCSREDHPAYITKRILQQQLNEEKRKRREAEQMAEKSWDFMYWFVLGAIISFAAFLWATGLI